jgi:hypothetical protein
MTMKDAPIREMNERATSYCRQGLSIEAAIKQTVADYMSQLKGTCYKILSEEEIKRDLDRRYNPSEFFEALRSKPQPGDVETDAKKGRRR